ncbi:putative RNA recognition motif domain, nucleotide-binding alpha-beta plait domain superfamily [Helianthus annuus]|nr:putative RNA recognition motif domain, nucleotide-binding alpha-beta plait domain superfamily [Helianthus annuus]
MEPEDEGGPWLDPHHRSKRGAPNAFSGKVPVTKFFVTNLPLGCTPWEVSEFVKGFGEVHGVYIARKKDKVGNRFGFISFKNVRDVKELEKALNGTKMGNYKLRVNVAKFAAENSGLSGGPSNDKGKGVSKEHNGIAQQVSGLGHAFVNQGGGRLYSDLFKKETEIKGYSSKTDGCFSSVSGNRVVVVPDRTLAFKDVMALSVVGRTVDLETLVDFDKLLRIAKVTYSRIQYLGGLSVLITFMDEAAMQGFLVKRDMWGPWFSKVEEWKGQILPMERVAWLRLVGIPLQLMDSDVFSIIGGLFGKVLHHPKSLDNDRDLSMVRVGVLAGEAGRIKEVISLSWKNKNFRILVEEEVDAWVPDCLGESVSNSQSSGSDSPMMSSPVVSRPEDVTLEEDGSAQPGDKGGDGSSPCFNSGSPHAVVDHLQEVRENPNVDIPYVLDNRTGVNKHVQVEPQSGYEGGQHVNSFGNLNINGNFIFSPPVEVLRPTKKSFKPRPRSGIRNRNKSPNSNQRPKKRMREGEDFVFDLNIKAVEENKDGSGNIPSSSVNYNSDKVLLDSEAPMGVQAKTVPEGSPSVVADSPVVNEEAEDPDEVRNKSESHILNEIEATIRLGNVVGANLGNHGNIIREAIFSSGNNAVPR